MTCPRCGRRHSGPCGIPRRTGVRAVHTEEALRQFESLSGGGRIDARWLSNGRRIEPGNAGWQNRESVKTVHPRVAAERIGMAPGRTVPLLQQAQASERRLLRELRECQSDEAITRYDEMAMMVRQEGVRRWIQ